MRINVPLIRSAIEKVKSYMELMLPEKPVRPWSVLRYSADAAICRKLYGATIQDYFELHFYEKTHRERQTYFTSKQALHFINLVNGQDNNRKFYEKASMYRIMRKFTKRELLFCPPEDYREFEDYFSRHRKAFYKPNNTYCGNGIELWDADKTDVRELYERASKQIAVLDEPVVQHPDLARLNPDSLNTVKIYTMMIKDECRFIAAELRMGRRGAIVDNLERGGLAAGIDMKTGTVIGAAYDQRMKPYQAHPDTGVPITGLALPNWAEVLRYTEECALACPLAYVEWDFAIRENDCVLIEANANARNTELQTGEFHGRKKQFEELEKLFVQSNT